MTDPVDWQRRPGEGRYAKPERERRFLLAADPPPGAAGRRIEDHYIRGTRLRLRRVSSDGADVYKLTQKVRRRDDDPAEVSLTNTYLSPDEYQILQALPGGTLSKVRTVHRHAERDFVVDVFRGRLSGLRLAELEVQELQDPLPLPEWLGLEVTHDDRYSGGSLAFASDDAIRGLLAQG